MNGDFADVILAIGNTNYVAVNEEVVEKSLRWCHHGGCIGGGGP